MVGMLVLALAAFAAPSSARAESLEVNTGGSATQDIAHGITVSGVADGHHRLYVLINGFGGACASMPAYDGGSSLAAGTTLAAGSFEKSYSYTPTSQQTYTVCAYLDEEPVLETRRHGRWRLHRRRPRRLGRDRSQRKTHPERADED